MERRGGGDENGKVTTPKKTKNTSHAAYSRERSKSFSAKKPLSAGNYPCAGVKAAAWQELNMGKQALGGDYGGWRAYGAKEDRSKEGRAGRAAP